LELAEYQVPRLAASCKIVMGAAVGYLLVIMF